MKLLKYLCYTITSAVMLMACSRTVHVEKDDSVNFKKYKTYMWVDTKYSQEDKSTRPVKYGDITVRNAANEELKNAGWREVSYNPDVLVSYDILVNSSTVRRSDPVYTQSFTRSYYNPRMRRWGTIYYPSEFLGYNNYEVPLKEGTISLTFTDANTDKIVLQGWTTEELDYSRITTEEIKSSVKSILKKLDISGK